MRSRHLLVLLAVAGAVVWAGLAWADDDDDDSGDAGETCIPEPGPCDDQPTFAPISTSSFDAVCDVDGDHLGDLVEVTGDPHDFQCWPAECVGTCYTFSDLGSGVWQLTDT